MEDANQMDKFLEAISENMMEIPFDTLKEQLGEAAWNVAVDVGLAECLAEFGVDALSILL